MPRSGTSLTEQILSSHKNVVGGGELPYIQKIYNDYFKSNENLIENDLLNCNKDYLNIYLILITLKNFLQIKHH